MIRFIIFISIIVIFVALMIHRNHCESGPIKISGKQIRYVRNYKNKLRAQVKFPLWGWIDVTYSKIIDSVFDRFPEFKTEEEAKSFLKRLKDSTVDPNKEDTVIVETYIKDYSGNKNHFEEEK